MNQNESSKQIAPYQTPDWKFSKELEQRETTSFIVLHHSGVSTPHTAEDIHRWHLKKGWAGIGYHYFIAKNGVVYECRPRNTVGAHTRGYNRVSLGVCFEGDFNKEELTVKQENAAIKLLTILGIAYYDAELRRHSDFNAQRSCPGKNFPFDRIKQRVAQCRANIGL